jgi:hypothetical protein
MKMKHTNSDNTHTYPHTNVRARAQTEVRTPHIMSHINHNACQLSSTFFALEILGVGKFLKARETSAPRDMDSRIWCEFS